MPEVTDIKTLLIDDLWLPSVLEGGRVLYPRLRKNKRMKLLTLTDDRNFQEIIAFEENDLITKDYVTIWSYSHIKRFRLESELSPAKVLGPAKFEDSMEGPSVSLGECFPFDIVNLDFSSQNPDFENGRVEKEIDCMEKTINLQRVQVDDGFVLLYTTILNSNSLNYERIVNASNAISVEEWPGLSLDDSPIMIDDQMEKMECIGSLLEELCDKYEFGVELETENHSLNNDERQVFSIAGVLRRRS